MISSSLGLHSLDILVILLCHLLPASLGLLRPTCQELDKFNRHVERMYGRNGHVHLPRDGDLITWKVPEIENETNFLRRSFKIRDAQEKRQKDQEAMQLLDVLVFRWLVELLGFDVSVF